MKLLHYILPLVALTGVVSCTDEIDLDLPEGETRLVVDGHITNVLDSQTVKLTTTASYFSGQPTPPVTGATVWLSDETGTRHNLAETRSGVYQKYFAGDTNRTYVLHIETAEGRVYASAPELLHPVAPIDTLTYVDEEEVPFGDPGFYLMINAQEPGHTQDFYRWRYYVNDTLVTDPSEQIYASDEFVNGNPIVDFQISYEPVQVGDYVRVEQMNISRALYEYLTILYQQTSGGGPFDTPPAPVPSNVQNVNDPNERVLGFFYAAGITEASTVIE
ncbi:protein of unknown function [Catalinimonas alkaloidigena]|uniref:DUF4249 domain-containing protein n=1 Tax=Catalinimonas alkaloidigena TaxID=1075417 RepID=A0A1G9H8J6_9BACT|nr:DUF4249 domain-containing protein [Catalinimonas alkaloidigena]SDL09318.1 protein of unknown function [Catalinimonas alkaloidigena]